RHKLQKLLETADVPDPYAGGAEGFEQVLDLVEAACEGWLERLQ
ncbi:MAG: low molecular weight phosphotyrosine protein phosphatase, partial [Burkholderiales bacterium]|nr:low molecular weight phosphotyrosine protein phosphatase [Burkholderiales bacterium]